MDYNALTFDAFGKHRPWRFNLVRNTDALNRHIAREAVDLIKSAGQNGRQVLMITPVGPLDYAYWAELCNREGVSCEPLITLNMDEYLKDGSDALIDVDHPLSFCRHMQQSLVDNLKPTLRPDPKNIRFPDPGRLEEATKLVESFGGADFCASGFGITGHFAFNDPPELDEPCDDDAVRNSRTRNLTVMRESQVQMCMGGTDGNMDIIPQRAITLGMHELLMSKKIHLVFMRNWHAGILRRALFGPVTGRCPGSFIQQHGNVEVTLTELAARVPMQNILQATGETEE